MKIIIAGGRDFDNYEMVENEMKKYIVSEVVCGGAAGADSLGEQWARNHNVPIKYFFADWTRYGKSAGVIRNKQMAEYADYLVAFWDKESHGTKNMIDTMQQIGKHGSVVTYEIIKPNKFPW